MIPRLVAAVLAVTYVAHAALFGWYVADDAGISLAYARNLVNGYGPVLYPGAPAVEGYSNPLWVALLGGAVALRLDAGYGIPLLKILGLVIGAAAIVLTSVLARRAYPEDGRARWLAPALLVLSTPFVFWSGAGLENALYALGLVLAALLHLREIEDPSRRPWSAVALLAVALTRPEGCAFFVAFLVHRLVAARRVHPSRLVAWTAIFVAGYAAFLLLRFAVFGAWLPNTYYAKVMNRSLRDLLSYAFDPEDRGRGSLISFAALAWPTLAVACVGLLDRARWRANLLFAGMIGGTAAYVLFVGGDFWPAARFFTGVLPVIAVAAQHGMERLAQRPAWMRPLATATLLLLVAVISADATFDLRRRHRVDTLISLQGRLQQGHKIRQLAATLNVPDPLYMDPDIGGLALLGMRVLDLGGLTDIHIARFHYYPDFFRRYVFEEQRPHFIRTHASWTRSSRITQYPEFREHYVALVEYADERGLHGEFVRKDIVEGGDGSYVESTRPQPSFRQAIADGRAARTREDAREADGWIEYYSHRRLHAKLRARFREAERAGTLPRDAARLRELYYGLLAAGELQAARRIGSAAGIQTAPAVLYAGGKPVLAIIDSRIVKRPTDFTTTLVLYVEALHSDAPEYSVSVHLEPAGGGKKLTRQRSLEGVLNDARPGTSVALDIPLWIPEGHYDVRTSVWRRDSEEALCADDAGRICYLALGTHRIGA